VGYLRLTKLQTWLHLGEDVGVDVLCQSGGSSMNGKVRKVLLLEEVRMLLVGEASSLDPQLGPASCFED
jgi:hypothetical protein